MKVYLDDERETPEGWVRVYWPDEAIALLESDAVEEISLDHDLGDDSRGTGYDVVTWIEEAVVSRGFQPPKIHIHTANPSARQKMQAGVQSIMSRVWKKMDSATIEAFDNAVVDPESVDKLCLHFRKQKEGV